MLVKEVSYCLFVGLFVAVQTSCAHRTSSRKDIGAFCTNDTARGDPNLIPSEGGSPKLVRTVENGSLYSIRAGEDQLWLVHVWGNSGYDYGFTYGTLLKAKIIHNCNRARGLNFSKRS